MADQTPTTRTPADFKSARSEIIFSRRLSDPKINNSTPVFSRGELDLISVARAMLGVRNGAAKAACGAELMMLLE